MFGMACSQARATTLFSPFRFGFWCRLAFFLILILLVSLLPCSAQSDALPAGSLPFLSSPPIPTISKEVEEVGLILTVTDKHGRFVKDLNQTDFNIIDNGQAPNRITYFERQTDLPLRVALVIDTSDSVTYRFKFEQKAAAIFLKHVLKKKSDLGLVIGFCQELRLAQAATSDTKLLANGLKRLHPGGETAVYDAVTLAARELSSIHDLQPTRHAIIVITDGEDNRSHVNLQQVVASALKAEAVVYVVSTNISGAGLDLAEQGDAAMRQLSEATGGRLLRSDTDGDVTSAFGKIAKELRSQYALGYKPTPGEDGMFHRLVVLAPRKLRVFHRLGYFAR